MATGTLAITTTAFPDNVVADGSQVIQNFNDILDYINNRNDGTDEWQVLKVTATTTAAATISGNQATTLVQINNTATDGDPVLQWALGGTVQFAAGVSDGDSDLFKMGTTSIETSTFFTSDGTVVRLGSGNGSAAAPLVVFNAATTTGLFTDASANLNFSRSGTLVGGFNANSFFVRDGSAATPGLSFDSAGDVGFYYGTAGDLIGVAIDGAYVFLFDAGQNISKNDLVPDADNTYKSGTVSLRWSDLRSVLINGADYGFQNGWFIREYPATFRDIQEQDEAWMKANANKGLQIVDDTGQVVMVITKTGIYGGPVRALTALDPGDVARNTPSQEDIDYEIARRLEIRGETQP